MRNNLTGKVKIGVKICENEGIESIIWISSEIGFAESEKLIKGLGRCFIFLESLLRNLCRFKASVLYTTRNKHRKQVATDKGSCYGYINIYRIE